MFGIIRRERHGRIFMLSFIAFLVVYSFLYGIWRMPLIDFGIFRMSEIGIMDYAYVATISVLSAFLVSMIKYERSKRISSGAKFAGIGGASAAIVSTICPSCQGIAILAFGGVAAGFSLAFLIPYLGLIQVITVMLLGLALYMKADSIFMENCIGCGNWSKIMKTVK